MPNWCVTNWKIRGDKEKIQNFCDVVNSLKDKESVAENGFGPMWLVNLAVALGLAEDYESLRGDGHNYRGTIDCDDSLVATLIRPESEVQEDIIPYEHPNGLAITAFSTVSAWDMPFWLCDYFAANEIEYGYTSTDEFGNFHELCNTSLFPDVYLIDNGEEYWPFKLGEEERVAEVLKEAGISIDPSKVKDRASLISQIKEVEDKLYEKEIYPIIYDIVND